MKLPEALKMAVEDQNWYSVCAIYTSITGLPLEPPKPKEVDWANMDIDLSGVPDGPVARPVEGTTPAVKLDRNDNSDGEMNDAVASTLIADEGDNRGEGGEFQFDDPMASDPEAEDFISAAKTGEPQGSDQKYTSKQLMIIPGEGERANRFEDNLEASAHERVDINPTLGIKKVTPGVTSKPQTAYKIDVICSLCKNTIQIQPSLATGYDPNPEHNVFKCNDCNTKRGREKRRDS